MGGVKGGGPVEVPLYRAFAGLALGTTVAVGTPLGIWLLGRLYPAAGGIPFEWVLLHAHLQVFGFFGVLIPGVARHLFTRFAGRTPDPDLPARTLLVLFAAALLLRVAGTASASGADLRTLSGAALLIASAAGCAAFVVFAAWVWRSLPSQLAMLRAQLTAATGWFAVALGIETILRARALASGGVVPHLGGMAAVHVMGIFGGVVGWILGVAFRAGPMFVADWRVPLVVARAVPWTLGLGVLVTSIADAGWTGAASAGLARLGEGVAVAPVAAVALAAGAFRRARGSLPLLSRSMAEARFFRFALASAVLAAVGSLVAAGLAFAGAEPPLLADALRHLVTVGFLVGVVLAMAFRLIPVLERVPLAWRPLRAVAFWALVLGVTLRTAEIAVPLGVSALGSWLPLSGVAVWVALACLTVNLAAAVRAAGRARA